MSNQQDNPDPTDKTLDNHTSPTTEIYVSTDIEADGPIPGPHSMLSIGSAAYLEDKTLLATFSANLELLPEASADPQTTEWWNRNRRAYRKTRVNMESPEVAMKRYVEWLKALPGRPVFVAYPAGFDFTFVYWYLMKFAGESPFSFASLDMKTMAMTMMNSQFHATTKRRMPRHWFDKLPHTHEALTDAIEQGALFCNMLAELRKMN
ncbi:3'-5' exoribonuclease domain-containing protein [Planctomicrobium sp. SH527]|uniref:3'-5' exoribonuclease domain-containing protein n=1 Tax=Planctomicrobium sp. SH527 TaxID=3448123 RepID=UPI003F5BB507